MHRALGILLILVVFRAQAQEPISWGLLLKTNHEVITEGNYKGLYKPKFSKEIKEYEGKEVTITGYLIPMDVEGNTYALSMSPFSSCFFCGNAGPNTVIQLNFSNPKSKFLVDQFIMIKGTLILNRFNPENLFFILDNAEVHG